MHMFPQIASRIVSSIAESIFSTNPSGMAHPDYILKIREWFKWRLSYEGGQGFINEYLWKFSKRESTLDFDRRKEVTYLPAFAKSTLNEVKNSIFQRLTDITRIGGSETYRKCMDGESGGVDAEGTDMNTFIGQNVLPELLVMTKVGVWVDMTSKIGSTLAAGKAIPYIYRYCAEDILNWKWKNTKNGRELAAVRLRDYEYGLDSDGLPTGAKVKEQIRYVWIDEVTGLVNMSWTGDNKQPIPEKPPIVLNLKKIPFAVAEISNSLMQDVANYQIALLNVSSSDLMYVLHSNFPFYVEQGDNINTPSHLNGGGDGTAKGTDPTRSQEIVVGATGGRRYPKNTDQPAFISPPSEPLEASMAKQAQMKEEIRQLMNLSLSNVKAKMASAESKGLDERGLEAGLSYIGLELQRVERLVAEFWAMYTPGEEAAQVKYPTKYMLKTEEERWREADELGKMLDKTPSLSMKKEICKRIARVMLEGQINSETLAIIESEIDKATCIVGDPQILIANIQNGVLAAVDAASGQGIPDTSPAKAAVEHAARIARIQVAQGEGNQGAGNPAARGNPDAAGSPGDAASEKVGKAGRGSVKSDS